MIAQTLQTKQLSAEGFVWNLYSPRVATISNDLRHFAPVAYFAFDSWDEAHSFWKSITDLRVCSRAQVRQSQRFTSYSWEVKIWLLRQSVLDKMIERDLSRALPLPVRRDWPLTESYSAISYEAAA